MRDGRACCAKQIHADAMLDEHRPIQRAKEQGFFSSQTTGEGFSTFLHILTTISHIIFWNFWGIFWRKAKLLLTIARLYSIPPRSLSSIESPDADINGASVMSSPI